jgi:hypothetical protein
MAATWRADPAMKNAVIISVKLERGDGDTYRGVVQCVRGGEAFTIPLDVDAADRERIKWRLRP